MYGGIVDKDAALAAVARSDVKATEWAERREVDIEAAYRAGASLSLIAERCSLTVPGVRKLLIRRGVELRPPHVR